MSEFYTMPITTAKTNDSYIIPTSTHGSIFSNASHKHKQEDAKDMGEKKPGLGSKLKKIFHRD